MRNLDVYVSAHVDAPARHHCLADFKVRPSVLAICYAQLVFVLWMQTDVRCLRGATAVPCVEVDAVKDPLQ